LGEQDHKVARIVILSGERGAGKSTVCRETIALAQARGYTCGGLLTLSHPDDTLDVLDVRSGDVRRLTLGPSTDSGQAPDAAPSVIQGRFRFDPETLAWGNVVLARAWPCHLLVVDELGPLEIERGAGWLKAFDVLRRPDLTMALVVVRPELVARAQLGLPAGATTVLTVRPDNRDDLPVYLLGLLQAGQSRLQPPFTLPVPFPPPRPPSARGQPR
jgi:nucleoside-triphosphatase THEP1